MDVKTKKCPDCDGAGDNLLGNPCNQCGGPGRVHLDGTRIELGRGSELPPNSAAARSLRDSGLLWVAHDQLISVIKARVQRPLDRLPKGRADDLVDAMEDAIDLAKVLAVLREEIKQREAGQDAQAT